MLALCIFQYRQPFFKLPLKRLKIPHSVTSNKLLQAFIAVLWQLIVRHSLSMA